KVAESAFNLEAVPAKRIPMCAARNEHHIVSSCGHPSAEITSHGTCRHDRQPHVTPSASKTFVWGWTAESARLSKSPTAQALPARGGARPDHGSRCCARRATNWCGLR